ncbi:hypothetical protein [Helicobacter canis]|uniref:Uncharacterized protein n=1 Tax=Helicobacter canis NCTC 12740 TaxID=1357399 RepID=V8CEE2_9HELI|nr:hypothetical protein [Helicobacter canis]ETD25793.1 hypothetical protein HMPREF2087_01624 [Helicobacter canis NCTC 12740]
MQVIRLEDSTELQAAKNAIFRSLVTMLICYFLSVVPFVGLIASVVMLGAMVWYLVGVYKFSKLTNSSIFQSHMFMILITLGLGLMLVVALIVAAQGGDFGLFLSVVGLVYLIDIPIMLWLFWRICTEFSARTNLKQFILAFKFYVGSFALVIIACIVVFLAIDFSLWVGILQASLEQSSFDTLNINELSINTSLIYAAMLIFALALIATILSFVFYLLGVAKITEVSVRESSLSPTN